MDYIYNPVTGVMDLGSAYDYFCNEVIPTLGLDTARFTKKELHMYIIELITRVLEVNNNGNSDSTG